MSRRMLAVAMAVLMIAAVAVALAPSDARAAGASSPVTALSPAASHPAAIGYELTNGYGYYTSNVYYMGEIGWETLNFYVSDTLDHAVNVTITDVNAARDGVTNPAFTYQARLNTSTSSFTSAVANVHFTFPTVTYGGTWVVNFSAPVAGYITQNVTLQKYYVSAASSVSYPQSLLPTDPLTLWWWAYLDSNGASPYTGATTVTLWGHYSGNGTYQNFFPGGKTQLTVGSTGSWSGTVPSNATGDTEMHFEFNVITNLSGTIVENESENISVDVGYLYLQHYGLSENPTSCLGEYTYYLTPGPAAACVQIESDYADELTPAAGLPVKVNYWNGTANVTPVGAPTSATTDSNGDVTILFNATSPPFTTAVQYPYDDNSVNFTVTVPGAHSSVEQWTLWENLTDWEVSPYSSATGIVSVSLDHTQYYVGATVTATWSISSTGSAATGPLTPEMWQVWNWESYSTLYTQGTLGGTAQSGTFTFTVTSDMLGQTIQVYVLVSNSTDSFDGWALAEVVQPTLLVNTASGYYTTGGSIQATVALSGTAAIPAGTTISWDAYGWFASQELTTPIGSGTTTNGGSFSIPTSATTPPTYVEIDAYASSGGQLLVSGETEVSLETGYSVQLSVQTVSNYVDGSFQPGQTVTLAYAVAAIDGTALPQTFSFELYMVGFPVYQYLQNVAPSGTVALTIPSDAKAGTLQVVLDIDSGGLTAGECQPTGQCAGTTALTVNPSPSILGMELGAGSGLTVGWVILLVIILLVAIVLFLALRRRGGRSSSSSMPPPAPAPSTPPAAEWKESPPPASSDAQPPLPPPSGSS